MKSKGNLIILPHNIELIRAEKTNSLDSQDIEKNREQEEEDDSHPDHDDYDAPSSVEEVDYVFAASDNENEEEGYESVSDDKSDLWYTDEKNLRINDCILFKKILQNCQRAEIKILEGQNLKLSEHWCSLRHASVKVHKNFDFALLGDIVRNLLNLKTMILEIMRHCKSKTKKKNGCFGPLNKLPCLKRMKLVTNSFVLRAVDVKQDLDPLYCQPRNFIFSIKVYVGDELKDKENPSLVKILNAAEYLRLNGRSDQIYFNSVSMKKEERKRMKHDKKNIVSIDFCALGFDAAKILSYCGSMEYLYIRDSCNMILWNQKSILEKGFRNLKAAVLDFGEIFVQPKLFDRKTSSDSEVGENSDIADDERKKSLSPFSSSLLPIISQIKEKSCSFQRLDLSFYLFEFPQMDWRNDYPKHRSSFIGNFQKFMEEISTFDKIKTLEFLAHPENLISFETFPLTKILSNKGLESFKLDFIESDPKDPEREWGGCFATENTSEIKKLVITIPTGLKVPLLTINLLNYIRKLDNLQVVELIDSNLELIAFDFLYAFVTSLLDKDMRKLIICTRVENSTCPNNLGMLLSKSLETQFQDILNEAAGDWASRIKKLNNLEEIIVGRLYNYSFDYLVCQKEMQVTDKLLWTQKEIDGLLDSKREFAKRYKKVFDLFSPKRWKEVDSHSD